MNDVQPPDFSELDDHVAAWGLPTLQQRREKRLHCTFEELKSFHDAMMPRLEEIIAFLDQFPVAAIPPAFTQLADAVLAMCEVDDPVSKWRSVLLEDALDPRRFTIKKTFYDTTHSPRHGEEPT
jgi:hypothetical protein